jgi:hypothetical protein
MLRFGSELLLHLEADRIDVHFVGCRRVTQNLGWILAHGCVKNGDLYQQSPECAFFAANSFPMESLSVAF